MRGPSASTGGAAWSSRRTGRRPRAAGPAPRPPLSAPRCPSRACPAARRPPRRPGARARGARGVAWGRLAREPGSDVVAARRALLAIDGVCDRLATEIVIRTLYWPDAFPAADRALQRAAGVGGPGALRARAERWRPWRAYAALPLWLRGAERPPGR